MREIEGYVPGSTMKAILERSRERGSTEHHFPMEAPSVIAKFENGAWHYYYLRKQDEPL